MEFERSGHLGDREGPMKDIIKLENPVFWEFDHYCGLKVGLSQPLSLF